MEITIENYRGYEIRFNTNRETFVCDIDDERSVKKSFGALKKFIDRFIKDNDVFNKFKIIASPNPRFNKRRVVTVIGQRKDGRFIGQDEKGDKFQISDYDLKQYCLYEESLNPYFEELELIKQKNIEENKRYELNRKEIISKMNLVSLYDYKQSLTK